MLLLCCCGLSACHQSNVNDLHKFVLQAPQAPASIDHKLPSFEEEAPLSFHFFTVKDPFLKLKQQDNDPGLMSKQGCLSARVVKHQQVHLIDYAIKELTMHGTLTVDAQRAAILEAPNQLFYRVNVGNYVGKEQAKVMSVSDNTVRLSFLKQDLQGCVAEKVVTIKLISHPS